MEDLKYTEILQLNKNLIGKLTSKPYQIGILSNVTVNAFNEILEYSCRTQQIEPHIEIGNFDNIVQDSASFNNKELVIIFYDTLNIVDQISTFFEDLDDNTIQQLQQKLVSELYIIFENLKSTPSVIFNLFSDNYYQQNILTHTKLSLFVNYLNEFLKKQAPPNFTLIDISKIYAQQGFNNCFDQRFYLSSKAPYSVNFLKNYALSIQCILLKNNGKLKKAIIFDCDNTLWKGIIGEDGIENIEMSATGKQGMFYHKVQQIAVFLSKRGVIIGLCSKNNEADVLEVLKSHKDMVLKEENIVVHKINWLDKASNLRQIAIDLNIGIESLVFVDDSSFEINLIKEQLPEIHTIQVPTAISNYPALLLKNAYTYFNLSPNTDDLKKTEMYKEQFLRENTKNQFGSIEDYLASLEIELKLVENDCNYIPRIAQLTQKTNQFNLTTYRYTENQIDQFMSGNRQSVIAMFVKDKFGDSGLTGVCILKENEQDPSEMMIDSLLMSCRIIGRNIEYVFLHHIIKQLRDKGYKSVSALYIPTKKNMQVESYYEKLDFQLLDQQNGLKKYKLNITDYYPKEVNYIKINSEPTFNTK